MRASLILAALPYTFISVAAAQTATTDTLVEARRLRDASDYAGAAALMRPYIAAHPDDPGSARFTALMSYWSKDRAGAGSIYAGALSHHPRDIALRLEYAKFLVETSASARAESVLAPVIAGDSMSSSPTDVARARTLLGTTKYWRGDYTGARREFRSALQLDSSVADARRQLTEIETASASWMRLGTGLWNDDQPLRFAAVDVDGGWFANPLTPIGFRGFTTRFDAPDAASGSVSGVEATLGTYLPGAHLDVSLAGGPVQVFRGSLEWTAHAALGVRLPRTVVMRAKFDRLPYTSTVRSLVTPLMVRTVEGAVQWGTLRGWTGELVARRATYPDDNSISTAFGWMLVPLVRHATTTIHAGYGFAAQSAEQSRFEPRFTDSPFPPPTPTIVPGEYDPYYTPRNLRVHSALARAQVRPGGRWTLEVNGRYGISAHDDAPVVAVAAAPPPVTVTRTFYDRSFTPWNARGSIDLAATRAVRLGLTVEHGREAYYAFTTARLQLTYTFVAAALARADVH